MTEYVARYVFDTRNARSCENCLQFLNGFNGKRIRVCVLRYNNIDTIQPAHDIYSSWNYSSLSLKVIIFHNKFYSKNIAQNMRDKINTI